jgi:hypothetical protein
MPRPNGWERHVANLAKLPPESNGRISERLKDF